MTLTDAQLKAVATDLRSQADVIDPLLPTPPPSPVIVPVADSRFVQVLDEQFVVLAGSVAILDPKSWWAPYNGVPGTGGVGRRNGNLATIRNGNLVLAATRPNNTTTDYNQFQSTGAALGPLSQLYGRWEVRAKSTPGAGFWPNMQLWPTAGKQGTKYGNGDGWPSTIEVDIFESPEGDRSKAHTTIHYAGNQESGTTVSGDFTQFHNWIVEWTPGSLLVLLDGAVIRHETNPALVPSTPHHFVAQTDMGSWAGVPSSNDPVRMELELDYVRQWKYVG